MAEQHHPRNIEHFRGGDPESPLEFTGDTEPLEHCADLWSAAVDDNRLDAAVAQKHHVGGEPTPQGLMDHCVAAVLDDHDLIVQVLEPRQRLGQHMRPDITGN